MSADDSTHAAQSSLTHSQQRSDAQPVRPKAAKCTDSQRTVPVGPEGLGTRLSAKQVRIADGAPEANAVSSEAGGEKCGFCQGTGRNTLGNECLACNGIGNRDNCPQCHGRGKADDGNQCTVRGQAQRLRRVGGGTPTHRTIEMIKDG